MAESLAKVVVDAAANEVPPPPRRTPKLGLCESAESPAASKVAWDASDDARRFMPVKRDKPPWKTLRTAYANLRAVIDAGLHAYVEEYLVETERFLADTNQRGFTSI